MCLRQRGLSQSVCHDQDGLAVLREVVTSCGSVPLIDRKQQGVEHESANGETRDSKGMTGDEADWSVATEAFACGSFNVWHRGEVAFGGVGADRTRLAWARKGAGVVSPADDALRCAPIHSRARARGS